MSDTNGSPLPPVRQLSLEGISALRVTLTGFSDEAEKAGLDREALLKLMVKRLRTGGLRVLKPDESQQAPGRPSLVLLLGLMKHKRGFYVYGVQSQVKQDVWLSRNPRLTAHAVTWEGSRWFGVAGEEGLGKTIRGAIRANIVEFLNAHQAANRHM